jgi:hypothetical protein
MSDFTHAWCELCEKIQPVKREDLHGEDTTGKFLGGDILCTECGLVLLTVYVPKSQSTP